MCCVVKIQITGNFSHIVSSFLLGRRSTAHSGKVSWEILTIMAMTVRDGGELEKKGIREAENWELWSHFVCKGSIFQIGRRDFRKARVPFITYFSKRGVLDFGHYWCSSSSLALPIIEHCAAERVCHITEELQAIKWQPAKLCKKSLKIPAADITHHSIR